MSGKSDTWWDGIKFRGSKQQLVELEYCDFTYVYQLDCGYREFHISNCSFDHMIHGVRTGERNLEVRNSSFTNCLQGVYGLNIQGEIVKNIFSKCNSGIDITTTSLSVFLKINDNEFIDNSTGMKSSGNSNGATPEITNNKFMNNSMGLRIYYGHHQNPVRNNLFAYNKVGFYFDEGSGNISYNTFKYNDLAVTFDIGIGGLSPVFAYNCFEHNGDLDVKFIYTSIDVDMRNNYWGTSDSVAIRNRIHDYFKDFTQPKAFYVPVLNAPDSSCQSVVPPTSIPDLEVENPPVTVYPNPAGNSINFRFAKIPVGSVITVYDLHGRNVASVTSNGVKDMPLDISELKPAIYIYRITVDGKEIHAGRFQKE